MKNKRLQIGNGLLLHQENYVSLQRIKFTKKENLLLFDALSISNHCEKSL